MKYLVDTDWVINHLNGFEAFSRKLEELALEGLAISLISVAEVYQGIYGGRRPEQREETFQSFLAQNVTLLNLDEQICKIFGREQARLRRLGMRVEDMDILIAATALRHGLIVLTNNAQHFRRVQGLEIISLQQNGEN